MFSEKLQLFRRLGIRHVLLQALNFVSVIASGGMIWKGMGLIANVESPLVVVLSGSMEPAFYRGDLIFLANPKDTLYKTGDITVYSVPGIMVPIVHRVLETHDIYNNSASGPPHQRLLTKGDNNNVDDIDLYKGLQWLEREHIIGKVQGYLPYLGYATIAMNDFPQLKYGLLGGLGLMALVQRE